VHSVVQFAAEDAAGQLAPEPGQLATVAGQLAFVAGQLAPELVQLVAVQVAARLVAVVPAPLCWLP
jgi:hypothetical protein